MRATAVAIRPFLRRVRKFARDHPRWTAVIIGGLIFVGVALVAPHAVLGFLGFRTVGIAPGTAAIYFPF